MERYRNSGSDSNVLGYEKGQNFISVWFKGGKRPTHIAMEAKLENFMLIK